MAQKDLDLRKLFARVKLKNTDKWGFMESSSFDTTDIAYLHSTAEVRNIPEEKRIKSISDFAISNFGWSFTAGNGRNIGPTLLRTAGSAVEVKLIRDDGSLDWLGVGCKDISFSVALDITTKSLISALSESKNVKISSKKFDWEEKHFIELGGYPGRIASQELQRVLEEAYNYGNLKDGLICTGRLYTTNGQSFKDFLSKQNPEFEFNGEKYVRVVVWSDNGNHYGNGTNVPTTGTVIWHKVEPVSLEIQNWDELPRSINPRGKKIGGAKIIKTETEECILAGLPFYPNWYDANCSMWQNSLIRAFLNSAKSSELDKNSEFNAPLEWDFSKSGFLYQAFDMTREATREYTISETEKEIADYAFAGCVGIEKIIVPSYVTKIGKLAFAGCKNSQIIFNNTNKKLQLDSEAFTGTGFKYIYLSKDGSQIVLSPFQDSSLEKSCFKRDFKIDDASKFFNSNYRINFVQLEQWKEKGKIKFIPPEYTLVTFPSSEMEKYFVNNNNGRWGKLVKTLGFDTLEGMEKNNSLVDLMKIYYAIGGFSENQGESERAYDYILKYVARVPSYLSQMVHMERIEYTRNPPASQIGEEIHARFSKLSLKGRYNPDFAKFL